MPGRVRLLLYNRLKQDTAAQVRDLAQFAGLPITEAQIRGVLNATTVDAMHELEVQEVLPGKNKNHPGEANAKVRAGHVCGFQVETTPETAAYLTVAMVNMLPPELVHEWECGPSDPSEPPSNLTTNWVPREGLPSSDLVRRTWPMPGASCERLEAGPAAAGYPQVLPKRAHSTRLRFVFVVGLEATGHHFLGEMFSAFQAAEEGGSADNGTASGGGVRVVALPSALASLLCADKGHRGLFGVNVLPAQPTVAAVFLEELAHFAKEMLAQAGSTVVVINTLTHGSSATCGEMSYPNFKGACKPWLIPDARLLAELFERAGLDLRILVTRRSAKGILSSVTIRRSWNMAELKAAGLAESSWGVHAQMYGEVLQRDILEQQLLRLSGDFALCLDYDALPERLPPRISEFLGFEYDRADFHRQIVRDLFRLQGYTSDPGFDQKLEAALQGNGLSDLRVLEDALAQLEEYCVGGGTDVAVPASAFEEADTLTAAEPAANGTTHGAADGAAEPDSNAPGPTHVHAYGGQSVSNLVAQLQEANISVCITVESDQGTGGLSNMLGAWVNPVNFAVAQSPWLKYQFGRLDGYGKANQHNVSGDFADLFAAEEGRGCRRDGGNGRRGQPTICLVQNEVS